MSKLYLRGASKTFRLNNKKENWGDYKPYTKSLIIRGIGYRMFIIENDFASKFILKNQFLNNKRVVETQSIIHPRDTEENISYWTNSQMEFKHFRYLVIRAGHTTDLYLPLDKNIHIKTSKKDRKMTIYGTNKTIVNNLAREIFNYRQPSVYTGRGIRRKHIKPIKKAGKKDKQKGKSF